HASRNQWDKARAAFVAASERGLHLAGWHQHAVVCLKTNDHAGYRRICTHLLTIGDQPVPAEGANVLARVCALGPDAVHGHAPPPRLAETAVAKVPEGERRNALNTLGALLYRAGRFREAIKRLREAVEAGNGQEVVEDWIFLALAHHRLGERAEAE